jgi:hypothetical protein
MRKRVNGDPFIMPKGVRTMADFLHVAREVNAINLVDAFLRGVQLGVSGGQTWLPQNDVARRDLAEIAAYAILGSKHTGVGGLQERVAYVSDIASSFSGGKSYVGLLREDIARYVKDHTVETEIDNEGIESLAPNERVATFLNDCGYYGIL